MQKINYKSTNRIKVSLLNVGLYFLFIVTVLIPFLFIVYNPISGVGHFFYDKRSFSLITFPVFLYFLVVGIYSYKVVIDPYIIQITSSRLFISIFKQGDYIDIAHTMLRDYSFFDRSFSFNKTLMLKIETPSGRLIAKRFNLTLISEKEIDKISDRLNRIIVKNN